VFGIGDIEVMRGAIHEGIDPQTLPSAVMEISTGSGICAGLPIVRPPWQPTHRLALLMSHSFEVNAAAVIAQFWPGASDQRISNGAPGTLRICVGCMDFRFHTTTVLPKCFIASDP